MMRRLSIFESDLNSLDNLYGSTIRTVICLEKRRRSITCSSAYFRLLRILEVANAIEFFDKDDTSNARIFLYNSHRSIPAFVFELFHLRYQALDYPFRIPAAISNLRNLQTLIIGPRKHYALIELESPLVVDLPEEIWRLPQLRHLILLCYLLVPFQQEASLALENLQTLSEARNLICSDKVLRKIPNLQKLGISYVPALRREGTTEAHELQDYELHNLIYLRQLEILRLSIDNSSPRPKMVNPVFPTTLKKLTLHGLRLPWKDMKIVGSLPNLEVLKLRHCSCDGDTWETSNGEFSRLKFLLIDESELQYWITESSHFPRLKSLVLRCCWRLRYIPEDIGEIPTLELIEVDDYLLLESAKQIQDDQQSFGNDALQVRLVKKF